MTRILKKKKTNIWDSFFSDVSNNPSIDPTSHAGGENGGDDGDDENGGDENVVCLRRRRFRRIN
jgi:hypothetical protein